MMVDHPPATAVHHLPWQLTKTTPIGFSSQKGNPKHDETSRKGFHVELFIYFQGFEHLKSQNQIIIEINRNVNKTKYRSRIDISFLMGPKKGVNKKYLIITFGLFNVVL